MIRLPIPLTEAGYATFLAAKKLPSYTVHRDDVTGAAHVLTDEISYASVFGESREIDRATAMLDGESVGHMKDFQRVVAIRALAKKRFAALLDCGLGKTPIEMAWAHAVAKIGKVLILTPLALLEQMQRECERWHGHRLVNLRRGEPWSDGIAITNFEGRREIDMTGVAGIVLDEASILKGRGETSDYLCDLANNVPYRLAASATPAPNEQAEYDVLAKWLGVVKTTKEFCSRFFRKDGTKFILKGHAVDAFYGFLASFATYIQRPSTLGFETTTELAEPPEYIESRVSTHEGWRGKTERLFQGADAAADRPAVFGEIREHADSPRMRSIAKFASAKGSHGVIAWALRNGEEKALANMLTEISGKGSVATINGAMPVEERVEKIDAYRAGELRHIVSKAKVLGFGVNLPECDRMVYSGYDYSFEAFYQAIRRAHRYGRKGRLKVLLPVTPPEITIVDSLMAKQATFERDVLELQSRFWRNT